MKRVAIVGAGPSGLTAAKAALDCGLEPKIFEGTPHTTGLWSTGSGSVWEEMKTNVSKWTCCFSDFPWAEDQPDFPASHAVESYLKAYAARFCVDRAITTSDPVTQIRRVNGLWSVTSRSGAHSLFDGVIVASGIFNTPWLPTMRGRRTFTGSVSHSASYKRPSQGGKRVAVVGSSFSGFEIAAELARHGSEVLHIIDRSVWVLPRYMEGRTIRRIPIDLGLYRRPPEDATPLTVMQRNLRTSKFFEDSFGNPGSVHPALQIFVDGSPPFAVISDDYLPGVSSGAIVPVRGRFQEFHSGRLLLSTGNELSADDIVFCTGYESKLDFLSADVLKTIEYKKSDKLISFICNKGVMHPDMHNLFFVGLYRGPFFGTIELQARWSVMMLAGLIPRSARGESEDALGVERELRNIQPRPQFPHGDYVAFSDSIANEIGVLPFESKDAELQRLLREGPVTPAQYRVSGPCSRRDVAMLAMKSAFRRIGFSC